MMRFGRLFAGCALAALVALGALACNRGNKKEDLITLPHAVVDTPAVAGDPVIFFQKSATDTDTTDDIAIVDVMLRSTASVTFDGFTMEIRFNPGLVQIGQLDLTATPLGDCSGTGILPPICQSNVNSPTSPANDTGDLLFGVGARPGGASATVSGTTKLFTLRLVVTTVGTSNLEFVTGAGHGDCEILASVVDLGIPCDSGTTTVTGAR
jgi:hypothetical protein